MDVRELQTVIFAFGIMRFVRRKSMVNSMEFALEAMMSASKFSKTLIIVAWWVLKVYNRL